MSRRITAAAGVVLAAALSFGVADTAHAADLDCKDFPNQAAAQATLLADPSDPNGLDANHNGVACEDHDYGTTTTTQTSITATTSGSTTSQVATTPKGAVAAGDGSVSAEPSTSLPYVVGGLALAGAGGAAYAARRSRRVSA